MSLDGAGTTGVTNGDDTGPSDPTPAASGTTGSLVLPEPGARRRSPVESQLGLRARITLGFTLGALVLSTVIGAATITLTRRSLLAERERRTIERTAENAATLEGQLRNQAVDADLNPVVSDIPAQGPQFLMLRNQPASGEREVRTFFTGDVEEADLPQSLVTRAVWDAKPAVMRIEAGQTLYSAVGIPLPESGGAYFELNAIDDISSAVQSQAIILILVGSVATLAGTALGWWASRRALRPLIMVGEAAGRIAEGHLETRLNAADYAEDPELGPLVSSFNGMVANLQHRIDRDAQFASDVSHELRSPLTTINASVDVLARAADQLPERPRKALDLLESDLVRFTQLVEDLLEISRFDAGAVRLELDEVNLMGLVRRAVSDIADGDLPVVADDALDSELMELDKVRVVRILANFIDNADKYGGGADRVEVVADDHTVAIAVIDSGPGVPPDERELIFERFSRGVQGGRRGAGSGVGLGLALVAEHARLMGGRVEVTDRPDGKEGARFALELPKVPPAAGLRVVEL
ncbi:MAG: HAMP domain-containing sensor histidine kinase [Microthrixaceae bacterium]